MTDQNIVKESTVEAVEGEIVDEKNKEAIDLKEIADKAGELAKSIWLAGLGAYGKAVDEAQGQYNKVTGKVKEVEQKAEKETANLFEELVLKGKKFEEETQVKFNEVKEKASSTLEERLAQVKSNLGFFSKESNASDLEGQLQDISSKLDSILTALSSSTSTKKTATRKSSASKESAAEV